EMSRGLGDVYKRQIKMPDVPRYTEEYRKHLVEIFG
ncbi:hypothetical protein ACX3V1_01180, partial [Escherichia coli]